MVTLDASALLAYMFREDGWRQVEPLIAGSCLSTVNLAEVLSRFARDGHDPSAVRAAVEATRIEFVDFTPARAASSARLTAPGRPLGLSLGDRACLALAIERSIVAVTADRRWKEVAWGVEVHTIR